jgi:hypothetical protein
MLVSPYSYYATLYLRRNRKALLSHGVEVESVCLWTLAYRGASADLEIDCTLSSWAVLMLALVYHALEQCNDHLGLSNCLYVTFRKQAPMDTAGKGILFQVRLRTGLQVLRRSPN